MENTNIISLASHLRAGKYFQLAAFVMLIYDHILTFSQEIDRIWKQRFSGATLLFLINRYLTPLEFMILLDAFHNPHWTSTVCRKFVLFEGIGTVSLVAVAQLIMILRVFALYERDIRVLSFLMTLWLLQIIISAVGLRTGFPVPLPPGLNGCILTGDSPLFPSLWIAPLITDSVIFLLTIYRTRRYFRLSPYAPSALAKLGHLNGASRLITKIASSTIAILVRDGALYFLIIFLANLMNMLLFFFAKPDLKAIGASFSQLITCTMISRLVLNLRSLSRKNTDDRQGQQLSQSQPYINTNTRAETTSFVTRALGNLGEEMLWYAGSPEPRPFRGVNVTTEVHHDIAMERFDHYFGTSA